MGSLSFEEEYASDQPSDGRGGGSYSPSADVSGSDSSSEISGRGFPAAPASASSAGMSLLPAGDVLFWEAKLEKRATDVSGLLPTFFTSIPLRIPFSFFGNFPSFGL